MALHNHPDDSAFAKELILKGKKIARLLRETVEADRYSRSMSTSPHESRWTKAAKKRNEAKADLKVELAKIAEEI